MKLLAVRHGMVVEEYRGRLLGGGTDAALSDQGRQETVHLSRALSHVRPARLMVSPLSRARDTAAILNRAWGLDQEVIPALRELEMGRLEGTHPSEMERLEPEFYRSWREHPGTTRFPGGESIEDLQARLLTWEKELRDDQEGTVVAVTHLYVILTLFCHFSGLPLQRLRSLYIHPSSVTRWTLGRGSAEDRLSLLNWRPAPFECLP
jgi:broad specificity phosphatase PhoE